MKIKKSAKTFQVNGKKYRLSLDMSEVLKQLPPETYDRYLKAVFKKKQTDLENSYEKAMYVLTK